MLRNGARAALARPWRCQRASHSVSAAAAAAADEADLESPAAKEQRQRPKQEREQQDGPAQPLVLEPLSSVQRARNAALVERLRGQLILAPLTRGNSLPFRRLCAEYGAHVTFSEMAFARQVVKNSPKELAMMRRSPAEACYGVQIATNAIGEGVRAGLQAAEAGADFVDLNVGCPIYEATRRGLGAALLRKPKKLAKLVRSGVRWGGGGARLRLRGAFKLYHCTFACAAPQVNGMALQLPVPLTVKVRLGENDKKINVEEVVGLLQEAGAAAVTVHGRWAGTACSAVIWKRAQDCCCLASQNPLLLVFSSSNAVAMMMLQNCPLLLPMRRCSCRACAALCRTMQQRYSKPADWAMIEGVAGMHSVPLIGNGDVLTHYDAKRRMESHGCLAVMVGR
jgi:tRNA-dihydrouridine synthase 3